MNAPTDKRVRHGKTRRDSANGYQARRAGNRDARNAYCAASKEQRDLNNSKFPFHACNGKKNRYRVTGKNKQTVFLRDLPEKKKK